ncbi:diaminopimelate epimerase [Sphingomonas montana]|uniref:diaminopimelate epimerase n=1 Tax=Sphingomonas montana TaxID=1843236 RepID=UPI0009700CF3|nr:diaminopimelate epimerase [Sphingomonas montana]
MTIRFTKMHGLGNDFVVIDGRAAPVALDAARVRAIADRRTGVGCDQLILLSGHADAGSIDMRIFNADGSEVSACGNATRCVPVLLGHDVTVVTAAGRLDARLSDGGAAVDMGLPDFAWDAVPIAYPMDTTALPVAWEMLERPVALSVGNPHLVFFVADIDAVPLDRIGPTIETDPLFPERINVNIASATDRGHVRMRTWERGAGLTRACGTGACATFAAGRRLGLLDDRVQLTLPGGDLILADIDGRLSMTGAAVRVFDGTLSGEFTA